MTSTQDRRLTQYEPRVFAIFQEQFSLQPTLITCQHNVIHTSKSMK